MVLSALSFIETKYKNKGVSSVFLLKDKSTIDCKGFDMYLAHYYMLYYNQTWYQKQFHAIPLKTPSDFINDRKALLNYLKTKPAAEELFAAVKSPSRQKYLTNIYSSCNDIMDLLKKVKDINCGILKDWASNTVTRFLPYLIGLEWMIDAKSFQTPEINIQELGNKKPEDMMVHTGGSQTYKFQQHDLCNKI